MLLPSTRYPHIFNIFAAILSGFFVSLAFPGGHFPNYSLGFILTIGLVPLFIAMDPPYSLHRGVVRGKFVNESAWDRLKHSLLVAWIFGVVVALGAFHWVLQPTIYFGQVPKPLAVLGFVLYACLSASFFPIIFFPYAWNSARKAKKMKSFSPLAIAFSVTLLELILPRFFFWTFGSLLHAWRPVTQFASLFGFSGLSAVIFASNMWIAHSLTTEPKTFSRFTRASLKSAVLWGALILFGMWRLNDVSAEVSSAETTRVITVQPNFTFNEISSNPWRAPDSQAMSIETLVRMSETLVASITDGRKPDLIVWPESVVSHFFLYRPELLDQAKALAAKVGVPLLVQSAEFNQEEMEKLGMQHATMYSSSVVIYADGTQSKSYQKWIPIPFGETVPLENIFPFLGDWVRKNIGNTSKVGRGSSFQSLPYSPTFQVAPLICFDSIYPELPRLQTLYGNASILVNQANFVWMQLSNAGAEFLELDRFRAIENMRSLLLSSNTGPSVAIDPLGRDIIPPTPLMHQDGFVVDLPVMKGFTFYSHFGSVPLLIIGTFSLLTMVFSSRKKERLF